MNVLKGKVVLITGSGQGVGRGIAEYFAQEGATVITNNRRKSKGDTPSFLSGEELEKYLSLKSDAEYVAELIRQRGGKAEAYYCDVADYEKVKAMFEYIVNKYGSIDIVVNNAAITQAGGLLTISEKDWDMQTVVKMKGTFNCTKLAVPYMQKQGGGVILNCSSDAFTGLVNAAAYSAANAGVVAFTQSIARELEPYGISCNAFCPQAASPGHVTGFSQNLHSMGKGVMLSAEVKERIEKNHGDAIRLGPFLAYLCTDEGKKITGGVFSVKASGEIDYYTPVVLKKGFSKEDEPWTLEELAKIIPDSPLSNEYKK